MSIFATTCGLIRSVGCCWITQCHFSLGAARSSGYFFFFKNNFAKIKESHPEWSHREVTLHAAELYRRLGDAEKQELQWLYEEYRAGLPEGEPRVGIKKLRQFGRKQGMPMPPALSPMPFFISDFLKERPGTDSVSGARSQFAQAVAAWKALEPERKQEYVERCHAAKEEYAFQFTNWALMNGLNVNYSYRAVLMQLYRRHHRDGKRRDR